MSTPCTRIVVVDPERPAPEAVALAAQRLADGEAIALPTETVYGLAADARDPLATARIFEAKSRPRFDPLIVHLLDASWLERVAVVADADRSLVSALARAFWPGPLTLVLPRTDVVPDLVCAGLPTVAVRVSAHPVFRAVQAAFGGPIAAPSANRFGRISPTRGADVVAELGGRIPLVLDAGPTAHGLESTIVRPSAGRLVVMRHGPVTDRDLAAFAPVDLAPPGNGLAPEAPGRLLSHYAPETPVLLVEPGDRFEPRDGVHCALLAWDRTIPEAPFARILRLSERGDLREAAANLFAALRELDRGGFDVIVAQAVPDEGIGVAINDRLRRAAARGRPA